MDPQEFAPGTTMTGPAVTAEEARQIVGLIGGDPGTIEDLPCRRRRADGRARGPDPRPPDRRHHARMEKYAAQLRTRGANGKVAYSEVVTAVPDRDGSFVLRWDTPVPEVCATHEFRLRADGETEWRPWRRFVPLVE